MSGIAGILRLDGHSVDTRILELMIGRVAHRGLDGHDLWGRGGLALGHLSLHTTPESVLESQPVVSPDGSLALVADARIDNRDELLEALMPNNRPSSEVSDPELVLASYRTWGTDCVARLLGDFTFALWDQRVERLLCARDHVGVKSFYYHRGTAFFAFASEIKALLAIPEVPREIDEGRIATHLLLETDDRVSTFYRDIRRLPAAHWLSVEASGSEARRYWSLDPEQEIRLGSDGEYEEAFRELFTEAVRCRLRSPSAVGSTLSGGLDSSAIACTASEILCARGAGPLHTFSATFPSLPANELRRIDERPFVDEVLSGTGFAGHRIQADRLSPLDDLAEVIRDQDEPHVPINLYLHRSIYQCARESGVRVILDGFDGDTILSHGLDRLAELARSLRWPSLLREARALSARSPNPAYHLGRALKEYALKPLVPSAVLRLYRWLRRSSGRAEDRTMLLKSELAIALGVHPQSGRRDDREVWRSGRCEHLSAMDSPLIQTALELADKAAAAQGVEPRYPFFDRRLMEFCLALPADQKLRDGWTRWILRRAMAGTLPPKVQWRVSKADLSPNVRRQLRYTCPQLLERILARGDQKITRFVDLEELSLLSSRFRAEPTNSDGLRLFAVTTLALWLQDR